MQNKSQSGSTGDIALENRRLKNVVSHSLAIFEAKTTNGPLMCGQIRAVLLTHRCPLLYFQSAVMRTIDPENLFGMCRGVERTTGWPSSFERSHFNRGAGGVVSCGPVLRI